jgi:hypothetical protein
LFIGAFALALFSFWLLGSKSTASKSNNLLYLQTTTPETFVSGEVLQMAFDPAGAMLYWTTNAGCPGGEFATTCRVRSKPTGNGAIRTVLNNSAGLRTNDFAGNFAVDANSLYWIGTGGDVLRLTYFVIGATPTTLVARENPASTGEIAADALYIYWTENVGDTGKLFRVSKAGGARELMASSNDSDLRQLKADGQGGVFYIADINAIFCCLDVLHRVTPNGSGGFDTDIGTNAFVQSYTTDEINVYWATTSGSGSRLHLEAAPLTNLRNVVQGIEADGDVSVPVPGTAIVPHMAVDDNNLYWHYKATATGGGPIFRLPLLNFASGPPQAITTNRANTNELTSTGAHLFWRENFNIHRLETSVAPTALDISIANLEITQGIQNFANDVPLVQEKWTMVRVYPALSSTATDGARATIRLFGERDGTALPGSPRPVHMAMAHTSGAQRGNLADSANIVLPPAWLTGEVTLRAEITVHGWFDSNNANNSRTATIRFLPKSNACLKYLPIVTTSGLTYYVRNLLNNAYTPGFLDIHHRFETLWPAPRVPFYTQSIALRKPQFLGTPQPFNMIDSADKSHVIGALWEHNVWDTAPDWCGGNNARTHYVAMVHPAIATGNTIGFANLMEPLTWVSMQTGSSGFDAPSGGGVLAQEIGHTYNGDPNFNDRWDHVNCGSPASDTINPNYPYITTTIGVVGPDTHWGFDRVTRFVIQPDAARDYMSYCTPRWTSDYTWRNAINATQNVPGSSTAASTATATTEAADLLLLYGQVNAAETSGSINKSYHVTIEIMQHTQVRPEPSTNVASSAAGIYTLQLVAADNSPLISQTLTLLEGTHHGAGAEEVTDYIFFATIDYVSTAAAVRLLKDGEELARHAISANPPTVTINALTTGPAGAAPLTVTWRGTDADGDALTYLIQYSSDNGRNWQLLATNLTESTLVISDTRDLPGSTTARVRVIASDGIHLGSATTAPFTLADHAPNALIIDPVDRTALDVLTPLVLRGEALDPEEGYLTDPALTWVITGATTLTATGSSASFAGLAPGGYQAQLTATDRAAHRGQATTNFVISPKRIYDSALPALDGSCHDAAYTNEQEPLPLVYAEGLVALVHFAHTDTILSLCFSELPVGVNSVEMVGVAIDTANDGSNTLQTDDRLFYLRRDGLILSGRGNGTGESRDAMPQGLVGAVTQSGNGWNGELQIDSARLGGWGRLVRMTAFHLDRGDGDNVLWPYFATHSTPATWGLTALGVQPQTIEFPAIPTYTYGDLPFAVTASATSGLPISFTVTPPTVCEISGAVVMITAAGNCTVTAQQPGNGSYAAAAPVSQSLQVAKASQTITFPAIEAQRMDARSLEINATASSGLPIILRSTTASVCTVFGTVVTFVDGGICQLIASQPGNQNYSASADVEQSFSIVESQHQLYLPIIQRLSLSVVAEIDR